MTMLGETGLRQLATVNHANAVKLADMLARTPDVEVLNDSFFNEFTIRVKSDAAATIERLASRNVLGGVPVSRLLPGAGLDDLILVASSEVNTDDDRAALCAALREAPVMLNTQGRPTDAGDAGSSERRTFTPQSRPANGGAADLRDRPPRGHRRRYRRARAVHAAAGRT